MLNLDANDGGCGPCAGPAGGAPEGQFRSLTVGARDLHLRAGADAAAAGIVLHPAFSTDIDGQARPVTRSQFWSMGADQ